MKKLYLVDVSSMFFRAYYAVRMLNTSEGLPTNAIFGFMSMSVKLLKDIRPEYMAYCFDRPEASFRKDIYPEYKANRGETPEDLIPQIPYIKKLTELMGIPMFEKEKYEADDVIGSLAKYGKDNKLEVVIVSGDKDFAQLIGSKVTMYDTMKDKTYDPEGVMEKWGVTPEQFIDYLAICGDSSDNIPGVRGIGPKGAEKLLGEFKNLDGVYKNLDKIKSKSQVKKLEEAKENAYLSQELVTIVQDLDMVGGKDELTLKPIDRGALSEVLEELEFSSFKKKLIGNNDTAPAEEEPSTSATSSKSKKAKKVSQKSIKASELKKWLKKGDEVFAWRDARSFSLCKGGDAVIIEDDNEKIVPILEDMHLAWKGFDIKSIWRAIGMDHGNVKWDHMLAAYLMKAGSIKSFEEIYQQYCGGSLPEFPEPVDIYPAQMELEETLGAKLKDQKMLPILQTMDFPLVEVLTKMESLGVKVDTMFLKKESEELGKEISELEEQIHKEAGETFNIASPKQLGNILFEKMGVPKGKKTKTGYSTATDVLEKLVEEYPITKMVLSYRELAKLKSTYVDALPELVEKETGRIHTVFNQAVTTTGRLSSTNPNLQNIPIRTERGQKVRKAFIADKGNVLLSADYSQIDLRVLAHITKDEGLCQAFNDNQDIHRWTASVIYDVDLEDVSSDQRHKAKAVNFGIAYGQGVYGLAETLRIERSEAKEIITDYFKRFPGVNDYMKNVVEQVKEKGYVETLFGRRRYIPEINSKRPQMRAFGERAAINAPIQGTSSDLVKMAMLEIFDEFAEEMLVQVHDELLFEIPKKDVEEKAEHIKSLMENCVSLDVPLKVNVAWGDNWSEAH